MESEFVSLPIDKIQIKNGRIREDLGDLESLAAELKRDGLLKPILIDSDDFSLVDGERRLRAAQLLGWSEITAHIKKFK